MTAELPAVLVTERFARKRSDDLQRVVGNAARVEVLRAAEPPSPAALREVHCAFMSTDLMGASNKHKPNDHLAAFSAAVDGAASLCWLHTCSSGTDRPLLQDAMRRGVIVTTSAGANALAVAHSAIAGMLALARGVRTWVRNQDARQWVGGSAASAPRDIDGQHAVILGMGHIGSEVARICAALRMNVVGLRSRSSQSELASALGNAYWVFLCCPLTTATRGMVDRAFLARLPRGASLVNVGRGELIVEQDLFEALQSGHLGAVYSDVFSEEPLPPESPWWGFDNVLLSPHIGGLSSGFARRTEDMFLDNLQRWLTGRPLVNVAVPASATA